MNNNMNIPWSLARRVTHLGYDYNDLGANQWDFIKDIPCEELENLLQHATLQRHYDNECDECDIDWTDIVKLTMIEQDYRIINGV